MEETNGMGIEIRHILDTTNGFSPFVFRANFSGLPGRTSI